MNIMSFSYIRKNTINNFYFFCLFVFVYFFRLIFFVIFVMLNNFNDFVTNQVSKANKELLPIKSKDLYLEVWTKYKKFCFEKKIEDIKNINSVYAYLNCMYTENEWKSPSTLWNKYSIIKSMVFNKFGLNFDNDPIEKQISLWIKNKQSTFLTKQSEMFTKTQVSNFL